MAGWGKTNNDPLLGQKDFTELGVSTRTLQRLVVPAVPFAKCTAIFPFVTDKQFCFGGISGEQFKFMVQGSAERWTIGCVNLAGRARWE